MSRKIAGSFATLLLLSALTAFLTLAPATAEEASKPSPALWKVSGPHGDVYFFGSIHLLPKGFVWQRPELEAALSQAQQLDFELDMDEAQNRSGMSALVVKYGFLPRGESLYKMLAPKYRERLDAVAKPLGLDPVDIDRMRPWFVATTLNSLAIVKRDTKPGPSAASAATTGEEVVAGVDAQLWAWASAVGKERGVLETTEDQVRVYADLSRQQEIEFLLVTLAETKQAPETLRTMLEAWKTGDTVTLDKAFNAEMDGFPVLRKAVLHDRHEKWLPQIERMMSDGRTHVVVVGAAHLVGDDSVIALLRAKGVKVEGP